MLKRKADDILSDWKKQKNKKTHWLGNLQRTITLILLK